MGTSATLLLLCDVVGCESIETTNQPYAIAVPGWSELSFMKGAEGQQEIVSLLLCPAHSPKV